MNFKQKIGLFVLFSFLAFVSWSQPKVDEKTLSAEANLLFEQLDYEEAYAKYSQLVSLYGSNPLYAFRFGASSIFVTADRDKSLLFMNDAVRRGYAQPESHYYIAKALHLNYKFSEALKEYKAYENTAEKKELAKSDVKSQIASCEAGINLLSSIKDIQVLEKTIAEKATFFRYYNVDEAIGKIVTTPEELKSNLDKKSKDPSIIFYPKNSKLIFFASKGKDGATGKDIYVTTREGGSFVTPTKVKGDINSNLDEDFAFLHPNGKTLYFASKGHGSMGGYDIFRSEYDSTLQQFGPAINLDFAINTPDDDVLFITDKENKIAYFASSRFTSSQNLNVYKVAVDGIPLNITYIKGFLTDQIQLPNKNCRFEIIDQNTGRKVIDTQSNESDGNFLLFIPKAGKYTYRIKLGGSPQVHEITVEIPLTDGSKVYKQELLATKENGREKVEIICHWDEPLNESVEQLSQLMLLSKANLDVNTTQIISTNSSESNETIESGSQVVAEKAKKILDQLEKDREVAQKKNQDLEEASQQVIALVQQNLSELDEAQEKLTSLQLTANLEDPQDVEALIVAKEELKEINEKTQAMGKALEEINKEISENSARIDSNKKLAADLNESLQTKNEKTTNALILSIENKIAQDEKLLHTDTDEKRINLEKEVGKIDATLKELNQEYADLKNKITSTEKKLTNTKKKKDIETLESEISQLKAELEEKSDEIASTEAKIASKTASLSLLTQLNKIEKSINSNQLQKPLPEFKLTGKNIDINLLQQELKEANLSSQKAIDGINAAQKTAAETNSNSTNNSASTNSTEASNTNKNSNSTNEKDKNAENNSNNYSAENKVENSNSTNEKDKNAENNSNNSSAENKVENSNSTNVKDKNAENNSNNSSAENKIENSNSTNEKDKNAENNSNNYSAENKVENSNSTNEKDKNAEKNSDNSSAENKVENSNSTIEKDKNAENNSDNSSAENKVENSISTNEKDKNTENNSNNSTAENKVENSRTISTQLNEALAIKNQTESAQAYEQLDLLRRMESENINLPNKENIQATQNKINEIEASMKTISNARELKKLDKKLEELYLERSLAEENIQTEIITLTGYELDATEFTLDSLMKKSSLPDSVRNKINQALIQQEGIIDQANDLRTSAVKQSDPIERADTYRKAFALESAAIEQNKKLIEFINSSETYFAQLAQTTANTNSNSTESNTNSNSTASNTSSNSGSNASSNITTNTSSSNTIASNLNEEKTTNGNSTNEIETNISSNKGNSSLGSEKETFIPARIEVTLFSTEGTPSLPLHSDSNPIPLLTNIPDGSFYTIQVGAFRKPVANNTFEQFTPVYSEQQSNGFIRYSTGFFTNYTDAKSARDNIRELGYKDAFIVAYKNGKRVGYTALMTEQELTAFNTGQQTASSTSSNTSNSTNNSINNNVNTTYYNSNEGVKADLIETSTGIFFTVQVGVYTKPAKNSVLESLPEMHVELMKNGNIRYMSGHFESFEKAVELKNSIRANQVSDAFLTAYENGKRISIADAKIKLGISN